MGVEYTKGESSAFPLLNKTLLQSDATVYSVVYRTQKPAIEHAEIHVYKYLFLGAFCRFQCANLVA